MNPDPEVPRLVRAVYAAARERDLADAQLHTLAMEQMRRSVDLDRAANRYAAAVIAKREADERFASYVTQKRPA